MTVAVVDTHALIWFLEQNPKLGKRAKNILLSGESELMIPVIVLRQLYFYLRKNRKSSLYASLEKHRIIASKRELLKISTGSSGVSFLKKPIWHLSLLSKSVKSSSCSITDPKSVWASKLLTKFSTLFFDGCNRILNSPQKILGTVVPVSCCKFSLFRNY